jgi:hypothetical protein
MKTKVEVQFRGDLILYVKDKDKFAKDLQLATVKVLKKHSIGAIEGTCSCSVYNSYL